MSPRDFIDVTRTPRHYELATFCFYCGGPVSAKQFCKSCNVSWERLFVNRCPATGELNDTWVHLYAPMSAKYGEGDQFIVLEATGAAHCEFCDAPHLYRWTPEGLELMDLRGERIMLDLDEVQSAS